MVGLFRVLHTHQIGQPRWRTETLTKVTVTGAQ